MKCLPAPAHFFCQKAGIFRHFCGFFVVQRRHTNPGITTLAVQQHLSIRHLNTSTPLLPRWSPPWGVMRLPSWDGMGLPHVRSPVVTSWWLNQPLKNMRSRQIGSWNPKSSVWKYDIPFWVATTVVMYHWCIICPLKMAVASTIQAY